MNEVVPPKSRGILVDIHGAALLFGYGLASWIGYGLTLPDHNELGTTMLILPGFYFYDSNNNSQWRAPMGMSDTSLTLSGKSP